jgi:hypothetical protein
MTTNKETIESSFGRWPGFVRYAISALPGLLLGLAYGWPQSGLPGLFGLSRNDLTHMVQLEFLVIHSFPFLAIIGLLRPANSYVRWYRRIMFGGLVCFYIILARSMHGWPGVFMFAGLTMATYLGFFLHITKPRIVNQLVIRWAVNFAIYMLLVIVLKMPEDIGHWPDARNIYPLGAQYFIGSALVELTGFYHAGWIDRLPISKAFAKLEEMF